MINNFMLINEISLGSKTTKAIILVFSLTCSSASTGELTNANEYLDLFKNLTGVTPVSTITLLPLRTNQAGYCLEAIVTETGENIKPQVLVNWPYWRNLPEQTKKRIVMHEMGHCEIGLTHQGQPGDIMYYKISNDIISQADFYEVLEIFALLITGKEKEH